MSLPNLTHLQFLVVSQLLKGGMTGRHLRAHLGRCGVKKSGPAFYQLMARMEDAGLVRGRYDQEIVDSQIIRQRHYQLDAAGRRAWQRSRDFYAEAIGATGNEEPALG